MAANALQCRFRELPAARSDEQELSSETWFYVAENDVLPEQLEHFLGMSEALEALFMEHHGDLLSAAYWRGVQDKLGVSLLTETLSRGVSAAELVGGAPGIPP